MNVLFIGGTGIISTACTRLAAERGIALTLLCRGVHAADLPAGVRVLKADIADEAATARALGGDRYDAVVDWRAGPRRVMTIKRALLYPSSASVQWRQ